MARLVLSVRRAGRPHLEKPRVERRGQAPDDPALSRRVPAFEHDDAALAVDDVRGLEPFEPILERREIVGIVAVIFRSEEQTSALQSLMRLSYAVFCLKTKLKITYPLHRRNHITNQAPM